MKKPSKPFPVMKKASPAKKAGKKASKSPMKRTLNAMEDALGDVSLDAGYHAK